MSGELVQLDEDQIARVVIAYRGVIREVEGVFGALEGLVEVFQAMARLLWVVRLRGRRPVFRRPFGQVGAYRGPRRRLL